MATEPRTRRRVNIDDARRANIPPIDGADAAIVNALQTGQPVSFEEAFPEPPVSRDEMHDAHQRALRQQNRAARGAVAGMGDDPAASVPLPDPGPTEVINRPRSRLPLQPETPPPAAPQNDDTPASRMRAVSEQSNSYLQEYRLKVLHRMLMRNLPLDVIAAQLQVSTERVRQMRIELQKRLIYEAQHVNRYEIAAKTLAFYDEVQGLALRQADDANARPHTRLTAMQTALAAQADRQRFLTASGFWGAAPFHPMDAEEDDSSRAAGKIQQLIEMVLDDKGDVQIDLEATDEHAAQRELDSKVKLL